MPWAKASPGDRDLIHTPPIRDLEVLQLLLNGSRDGLQPEPGRKLRLRDQAPPELAPTDPPQPAPQDG